MTAPRVTVLGGTGFLGSAIVRALLHADAQVRTAGRGTRPPVAGDAAAVRADVRDDAAVTNAVAGADVVVNAVGLYAEEGTATFDAIHVEGAQRVARAARSAGAGRLIHVSGIGADPASRSRYVAARGRGEDAVRSAFPDADVLRPSVLFGPGDAFLATLERVTRLPVVPLFGDGRMRLQPVHVDDVAAAAAALAMRSDAAAGTRELGGAEVLEYRAIVASVLDHLGRRRPLLPVSFALWHALAAVAALLPSPPLTRDQIVLMEADNVAAGPGFEDLGIDPRGLAGALPECLPPAASRA